MKNDSSVDDEIEQVKGSKSTFTEAGSPQKSTNTKNDQQTMASNDKFVIDTIPNKWRSKLDYPMKFIIIDSK